VLSSACGSAGGHFQGLAWSLALIAIQYGKSEIFIRKLAKLNPYYILAILPN
jgi:hypothetical protein